MAGGGRFFERLRLSGRGGSGVAIRDLASKPGFQIGCVWALSFLVFAGTFANGWTYDDFPVIVNNPDVTGFRAFLENSYPGRPLRELTYLADRALFGPDPFWWHLQQIFWHALNGTLVYCLARQLGGSRALGWLAALVFVVHPLQVEVVANISHRKDSLALAFSLLAILAYIRFCSRDHGWKWLLAALVLWIVALFGKLNAICLPVFLAAWEYCCVARSRRFLLQRPLPLLWAACAVAATVGFLLWMAVGGGLATFLGDAGEHLQAKANYFASPDVSTYLQMILKSWGFMFVKFLLPVGLAPEYTYPVPSGWFDPWVVGTLGCLLICIGLLVAFRGKPLVFLPMVLVAVFWLPVSNLWPVAYFAADRYMYAPSAGVVMLFAFLSTQLFRGKTLLGVSAVVLLTLGALTVQQVRIWHSPMTLWSHAIEVSPRSTFALNNMGNNYLLQGDLDRAMAFYKKSVEANPTNPEAQYNLGLIYERKGAMRKALRHYRNFVQLKPEKYATEVEAVKKRFRFE